MGNLSQQIKLIIKDKAKNGDCYAMYQQKKVFVPNSVIGDELLVELEDEHPTYFNAQIIEIIKPSSKRTQSYCNNNCGACSYLLVDYQNELQEKKADLLQLFANTIESDVLNSLIVNGMVSPFNYRNKAIYACDYRNEEMIVGLYSKRSHNIIPIHECALEDKWIANLKNKIIEILSLEDSAIKSKLRYLFFRGFSETQKMCVLVFSERVSLKHETKLVELCRTQNINSLQININNSDGNRILGDEFITLNGDNHIYLELLNKKFKVTPKSFFQVNKVQTEILYSKAIELLAPKSNEILADLYCGVGTISLSVADKVKKVYGVECVKEAIDDAIENAKLNNITNTEFICGYVENVIPELFKNNNKIDIAILDPARKGCEQVVLSTIADYNIERLVYISCNPTTQKRDIEYLKQLGYVVTHLEAVDLFPHTEHVETVILLSRGKQNG